MGSANASKQKSNNTSTSGSESFGQSTNQSINQNYSQGTNQAYNENFSQGTNQAFNQSLAQGTQGSQSLSGQSVWGGQSPYLEKMYGIAGDLLGGDSMVGRAVNGVANNATRAWQESLVPGGNPYFERNVQSAIDQASQSFNRQILPGLTDQGVGAGAFGGSRDQLARGEAAGLAGQGIAQMTGNLYGSQYQSDMAQRQAALAQTGAMQGALFAPLQQAQSMIGGPTVLGSSIGSSFGQNTANSMGSSFGQNTASGYGSSFGQNMSTGYGSSYGQSSNSMDAWMNSKGTGSGSSGGVGIGGK